MKVGILGGSFNPIHQGHIKIANIAIKKLSLDQVWLVPVSSNPFKEVVENSYDIRLDSVKRAVAGNYKIKVKNYEKISLSTYRMLLNIKNQHRNDKLFFIMGSDNMERLHEWDNFIKLISSFNIAIFSRNNNFINLKKQKSLSLIKKYSKSKTKIHRIKNIDISSTQIRSNNDSR